MSKYWSKREDDASWHEEGLEILSARVGKVRLVICALVIGLSFVMWLLNLIGLDSEDIAAAKEKYSREHR
jgi:hypothetical protein